MGDSLEALLEEYREARATAGKSLNDSCVERLDDLLEEIVKRVTSLEERVQSLEVGPEQLV